MKKTRAFISIAAGLALLTVLVPAVALADEGSAGGTFDITSSAPSITSVEVIPAAGGSAVSSMTPGTSYKAKIVANDDNTVNDIDQVRVAIVFDSGDSDPTDDPGETGDTKTLACLKWVKSGDDWSISPLDGGTTWSITSESCTKPADMGLSTGTWEFYFTVGKVATEGVGGSGPAGWDLFGEVKDEGDPVELWDGRDLAMDWYGEITVPTATVDWGSVSPGLDFGEDTTSEEALGVTITYIANGDYDEKVRASVTWNGSTYDANLDSTGTCGNAQEFALRADDTATYSTGTCPLVDTTGVTIDDTGSQTSETGDTAANNTLWLKLASVFAGDTYPGTIYYIIANG